MENKIEFNWELYQSGEYDCVTRDGRKVEQLHRFENIRDKYIIYGVIDNSLYSFNINGKYGISIGETRIDLFLIPKEKKEHIVVANEMVIPELKGVLMEVSDEEDFEETSQELIIGTLNGLFISNTLESWGYARPIKEVKECWVNVYEGNNGIYVVNQKEAKSFKSNFSDKYIKTIKITNEPETNEH